ncbi:hypothetical protein RBSWK_04641 [Rhodopirellula baltica SWK14]|uniref:Uncharacterized protein n=1 Tax=Rhodopirellula baltica SWK14 TaxID=993516 RepID=L7CC60_RHOBT|nr:hypothetical protein RBSWK_04641 [Rhodopirellula baltica SWK14]
MKFADGRQDRPRIGEAIVTDHPRIGKPIVQQYQLAIARHLQFHGFYFDKRDQIGSGPK